MVHPSLVVLAVAVLPACSPITTHQRTTVARPTTSGEVAPNRVSMPNIMGDEYLLDLPESSLTSDASLVIARREQTCVDLVARTISLASPDWEARLDVDGREVVRRSVHLDDCLREDGQAPAACTNLARRNDGYHRNMRVSGGLVCMPSRGALTEHTSLVSLRLRQGAYALRFEWRLQ